MKTNKYLFSILTVIITIFSFTSCSAKKDIVITDCSSNKVVCELSMSKNKEESAMLTNALNNSKDTNKTPQTIDSKEKYQVHFTDPKDSQYDIWFYIYITADNEVYTQYDKKKMENLNNYNKEKMDYSVKECTNMTADDLHTILNLKK